MEHFPRIAYDYPLVRDVIEINDIVAEFVANYEGDGPVFLLAREIRFARIPGKYRTLRPGPHELVIMADRYIGTGGFLDARGAPPDAALSGDPGAAGAAAKPPRPGTPWRAKPGENGHPGAAGKGSGNPGGTITLICREAIDVVASVQGGVGAAGGRGGRGGQGCDGFQGSAADPDQVFPGTRGGYGGIGGTGAPGGPGGNFFYVGLSEPAGSNVETGGGPGGPGGLNGQPGRDGMFYTPPDDLPPPPDDELPASGRQGPSGDGPGASFEIVAPDEFVQRMRNKLGIYANYWAPFRLAMGAWHYRRYHPGYDAENGVLAAAELERALEFQPDNAEALRLQRQLVGQLVTVPGSDVATWQGGGLNVLGLPRDLDMLPQFQYYQDAYTSFSALSLGLLVTATGGAWTSVLESQLHTLAAAQVREAEIASTNAKNQQAIAVNEEKNANDEITYRQQQLDKITADMNAAMAEMQQHQFNVGQFFGTVASVAGAVISVIGAIPSGGASLAALVPSIMALSKTVLANAGPIADTLFKEREPGTDPAKTPIGIVSKAAQEVGKQTEQVVKAGQAVAKFVTVIQNINDGATSDNAKYLALVKEGATAAHDLLLARNEATIASQRSEATKVASAGAEALVQAMKDADQSIRQDAIALRQLVLVAVGIAAAKMDVLLDFAYRAQRSVEIVTLRDETRSVAFDAGSLHPDTARGYYEGWVDGPTLLSELQAAWGKLLLPSTISQHFGDFISDPNRDHDVLRLSIATPDALAALRASGSVAFTVDPGPRGRLEAKARNVAVALIGARSGSGVISCEVSHGSRYEQRVADSAEPDARLLLARTSTRIAGFVPLATLPDLDGDFSLTGPEALAYWGRGIGGDWTIAISAGEAGNQQIDLSGLTEIQVWIGYQYKRA